MIQEVYDSDLVQQWDCKRKLSEIKRYRSENNGCCIRSEEGVEGYVLLAAMSTDWGESEWKSEEDGGVE